MSTPAEQAATATIAEVLRQHEIGYQRCSCGWFTEHGVVWGSVSQHLADVIAAALQLTEEWGIKYDTFPNDVVLGREKNPDGSVTRVMKLDSEGHARQAVDSPAPIGGFHKSAVSRLVGPWRGQHEGARD